MNKDNLLRHSLDLLFYSGTARVFSHLFRGMGAIAMLHHVRPGGGLQKGFAPNRGLEITPDFLDSAIGHIKAKGYELVSLAEAVSRIRSDVPSKIPFMVFTIDDAYRDVFTHAWPVFRRHECPFSLFVAPAITDGTCELWWFGLEAIIAGASHLSIAIGDEVIDLTTITDAQKRAAWDRLYWPIRRMGEVEQRKLIRRLCAEHGIDLKAICRAQAMGWEELRTIAADPLCTIGAHTVNHFALAKLPPADAAREIGDSLGRISRELGVRPRFFAYPYGDSHSAGPRDFEIVRDCGLEAAVTTRKGLVFPAHKNHLTALPRLSLNGQYQELRYLDVLLSGTAFAVWNGFRRFQAA